ncbi:hypothetical protein Pth03_25380 [Planotetraspora thailandica]|uniref:Uncharacterized protein n=1 Tax=Planotetraspora thailandica TaxID=487172 RepID=A0A8J3V525_9ACTN|nr:hypothetical protein [Planotetraspora thailandica]GII54149.1 hypothetical protein Pth03_25380 [Planotetraspora thailandica]
MGSGIIAAAAMALYSLSVFGNANRLRRVTAPALPKAAPASADLSVTVETREETQAVTEGQLRWASRSTSWAGTCKAWPLAGPSTLLGLESPSRAIQH